MRQAGQRDEYPHATLKYDDQGNLLDYHGLILDLVIDLARMKF